MAETMTKLASAAEQRSEVREVVVGAINGLPEKGRQALVLACHEGLSLKEIALVLDVRVTQVIGLIVRAWRTIMKAVRRANQKNKEAKVPEANKYIVLRVVKDKTGNVCTECALAYHSLSACANAGCTGCHYVSAADMAAITIAEYTGLNKAIDELAIQRNTAYDEIAALKEQNKALADDFYSLIKELKELLSKARNTQEG